MGTRDRNTTPLRARGYSWRSRARCLAGTVIIAASVATVRPDPAAPFPGLASRAELRTTSPITRREIAAHLTARSYAPNSRARLRIWARAAELTLEIFTSGPGKRRDDYHAVAITKPRGIPWKDSRAPRTISFGVGSWPSGLYYARLTARDGRVGFAPFIVRPKLKNRSARTAVILPTNTWQAYNFRDMDADGVADTWYADRSIHTVDLERPYLKPGMPRRFRYYDLPFLHWLHRHRIDVDFFADDDFKRFPSGRWLASRYTLIVFPGHEEYVTRTEYDLVNAYRNRGGNLAFLAANNFFYRVTRDGDLMHGRTRWRDLGRPEAALLGVQYVGWYEGIYRPKPYVVNGTHRASWFYAATSLATGDRFGHFGIEIDARATSSPPRTTLFARAEDIFGPGKSAEMTYYTTPRGAKVFAAGVLNFAAHANSPIVDTMLGNVFAKLTKP